MSTQTSSVLVSTARAAYDAYGELIRAGAPDTPEVHAERVNRLTSCLEGQYRDAPGMIEEDPVSALRNIPRALKLTWKEMSEAEQSTMVAQFPLARLIPQSL